MPVDENRLLAGHGSNPAGGSCMRLADRSPATAMMLRMPARPARWSLSRREPMARQRLEIALAPFWIVTCVAAPLLLAVGGQPVVDQLAGETLTTTGGAAAPEGE